MSKTFLVSIHRPACNWVLCGNAEQYTLYTTCELPDHPVAYIGRFCGKHAQRKLEQYKADDDIDSACVRGFHLAARGAH